MRVTRFSSLLLLFCLLAPPLHADDNVHAILNEARAIDKQADAAQGAWLSTGELIKKAEQALQKGDTQMATQLAKKARMQAQQSLIQARDQQKNWAEPPYIRGSRQ